MTADRISDAQLDAALRDLDAAPRAPLDDLARARSDAALERALAEDRTPEAGLGGSGHVGRARPASRLPAVGLAAGIAAIGMVMYQASGGSGTAYAASWTPAPTAASDAEITAAERVCADSEAPLRSDAAAGLQTRLAERRGDLVLLAMDDGQAQPAMVTCIVAMSPEGDAKQVASSGGGGVVRPAAGAITDASTYERTSPGDELAVINGLVGERVRAVTVHARDGLVVQATVAGGHYAAWWPGSALRSSSVPPAEGDDEGCAGSCEGDRLVPDYTLDVTLDDGTVRRGIAAADL